MNKFYITTPIYYVNDRPHSGHAYTTVAADVLARYHRELGERVFFLTGTDEHGAKIESAAQKAGKTPREFCDEKSEQFKKAWRALNISYDNFIRTTDSKHQTAVSRALEILWEKKFIYKGEYEGLYCQACEQYKNEKDLIDGKCPEHQREPILIKEESYLFKLSSFGQILRQKIESGALKIIPEERKNEALAFLEEGLKDISISRTNVKWGVPLPFDESQTTYVWVDAFLNYLTGIGWGGDPQSLSDLWPPDVQLMAKDILRVHAAIWTSLLLALGISLPTQLFVHGFFTFNGQKMSKSLGNVIWPEELAAKFGADATRYLLLANLPFGKDGDISWDKLTEKYNADLANGLGNLFERTLAMVVAYQKESGQPLNHAALSLDSAIQSLLRLSDESYQQNMANYQFVEALAVVGIFMKRLDQYINENEPWRLLKDKNFSKLQPILPTLLAGLGQIIWWLKPFMPEKMEQAAQYIENLNSQSEKLNLFPRLR